MYGFAHETFLPVTAGLCDWTSNAFERNKCSEDLAGLFPNRRILRLDAHIVVGSQSILNPSVVLGHLRGEHFNTPMFG